jgi:hypothetical protein
VTGTEIPSVELPEPVSTRDTVVHDALAAVIRTLGADDDVERFRRDSTAVLAEYLGRVERYGPAIEAAYLDEVAAIIGARPTDWAAADAELEAFVLGAGPEHDAALLQLFIRVSLRRLLLMEPTLNTPISRIEPLAQLLGRA